MFDVIRTLGIISTLAHRDDIVTLLSTKYPDVYSEIIIASSNDNDNNNKNDDDITNTIKIDDEWGGGGSDGKVDFL